VGAIKLTTFNFRDCNFVRESVVIAIGLSPNRWTGGLSNFLAIFIWRRMELVDTNMVDKKGDFAREFLVLETAGTW